MLRNFILSLLSLLAIGKAMAMATPVKRATSKQLYAYGDNIPGIAVYAGADNLAYIAQSTNDLIPLSWNIDSSGVAPWNVTTNSTTLSTGFFYIVASNGSYEQAGFVKSNTTAPSGASSTGFLTYGSYVMYVSDGEILSEFWAESTNVTGVWALKWNQDGASQTDSVAIALKTNAPSSSS